MNDPSLHIGTLRLHVSGMSDEEARALAGEVARALRVWPAAPVQGTPAEEIAAAVYAAALREAGR